MSNNLICFVLGLLLLISPRVHAQYWPPQGLPTFIETEFITAGGITYFRHVSRLTEWCDRIGAYPASREGTNLVMAIQQEGLPFGYICICDAIECGPVPPAEITSVLGALEAGMYRLRILSTNLNIGGGPFPIVTATDRDFVVDPGTDPTLRISKAPGGRSVRISVTGVTNVNYLIGRSPDLVSWTAIHTNRGAPFTYTVPAVEKQEFYRVSISQLPLPE